MSTKYYIENKEVSKDLLYFDIEKDKKGWVILIEYLNEPEHGWMWRYIINDEKFISKFKREYFHKGIYINEWKTKEFDTKEDVIEFVESCGIKYIDNYPFPKSKFLFNPHGQIFPI